MKPLFAALALLPALAFGQAEVPRVSLDARGDDVREVIATLFTQVHRPYAIDARVGGKLYVAFDRMPFPKALDLVLSQANLVARDRDGVTMIAPAPKAAGPKAIAPKPVVAKPPVPKPDVDRPADRPASIPPAVLARRVTTHLTRAPLADVFAALGQEAKIEIEVDPTVPAYRVDAVFAKVSLHRALDWVCRAAHLRYEPSATGIRIVRA